jgi:chromosome partitioning protein
MILALINTKGGVGKTTSAVSLAAALAERGHSTLLIDLDSQCSASLSLGLSREDCNPSSAHVMFGQLPAIDAVRSTDQEHLSIMPASIELASIDLTLASKPGREGYLARALAPIRSEFEYIILDCPPSLSLVPINALVAADAYVVPITPQYLSLEGLATLLDAVDSLRESMDTGATMLGLLLTLCDHGANRSRTTKDVIGMIRTAYGKKVFDTEIPVTVRLGEAPGHGKTIFAYDNGSPGASAYRQLATEVIARAASLRRKQRKAT